VPLPRWGRRRKGHAITVGDGSSAPDPGLEEARFVIAQTGEWIRGADTKAGFALAALTLLIGAMASDAAIVRSLWQDTSSWSPSVLLVVVSFGSVVIAFSAAVAVVMPRTSAPQPNRFSWPWLAGVSEQEALSRAKASSGDEAWRQARTLALVCARKHWWLRVTLWSGLIAAVSFLTWRTFFN